MEIPQSIRELIAKAPLAHLTTLNSDGSPQVTVIWVGIENEEFVIAHLALHKKVKNIRRDPRVALSMLGDKINAISGAGSCLPAARHAQHSRIRHPNHTEALHRDRAVGWASCRVGGA